MKTSHEPIVKSFGEAMEALSSSFKSIHAKFQKKYGVGRAKFNSHRAAAEERVWEDMPDDLTKEGAKLAKKLDSLLMAAVKSCLQASSAEHGFSTVLGLTALFSLSSLKKWAKGCDLEDEQCLSYTKVLCAFEESIKVLEKHWVSLLASLKDDAQFARLVGSEKQVFGATEMAKLAAVSSEWEADSRRSWEFDDMWVFVIDALKKIAAEAKLVYSEERVKTAIESSASPAPASSSGVASASEKPVVGAKKGKKAAAHVSNSEDEQFEAENSEEEFVQKKAQKSRSVKRAPVAAPSEPMNFSPRRTRSSSRTAVVSKRSKHEE